MLPCRQLLGGDAEGLILSLVARHRAEEMTVELRDQACERSATQFVEPRFADVFSWSLGGVEAECPDAVQLEDGREEPVRECFGIMSGPRQLLRARDVPGGIDDDSRLRRGRPCSKPRARPNDPPYHVAEVHHDDDEHDHGEADPDAVPEGVVFGETVQPVAKVISSLNGLAEHHPPRDSIGGGQTLPPVAKSISLLDQPAEDAMG